MSNPFKISVVIPTYNEAQNIINTLKPLVHKAEIIVCDGNSTDNTQALIKSIYPFVKILNAPIKGRGIQMQQGAKYCTGDVIVFCHADTLLEANWNQELLNSLNNKDTVGGYFSFAFYEKKSPHWISFLINVRCWLFKTPYGDQALFVRTPIFKNMGGYNTNIPILEDLEFVTRMKKIGRMRKLKSKAFTSNRYYKKYGWCKSIFRNRLVNLAFHLGVSPHKLAKYRQCLISPKK